MEFRLITRKLFGRMRKVDLSRLYLDRDLEQSRKALEAKVISKQITDDEHIRDHEDRLGICNWTDMIEQNDEVFHCKLPFRDGEYLLVRDGRIVPVREHDGWARTLRPGVSFPAPAAGV